MSAGQGHRQRRGARDCLVAAAHTVHLVPSKTARKLRWRWHQNKKRVWWWWWWPHACGLVQSKMALKWTCQTLMTAVLCVKHTLTYHSVMYSPGFPEIPVGDSGGTPSKGRGPGRGPDGSPYVTGMVRNQSGEDSGGSWDSSAMPGSSQWDMSQVPDMSQVRTTRRRFGRCHVLVESLACKHMCVGLHMLQKMPFSLHHPWFFFFYKQVYQRVQNPPVLAKG